MSTVNDPCERLIREALDAAGEPWTPETDGRNMRLDFYLQRHRVHIEVKQFYTERAVRQMERAPFAVLVQGREAAKWMADLIRDAADYRKEKAQ